jgi:hypothetical protein
VTYLATLQMKRGWVWVSANQYQRNLDRKRKQRVDAPSAIGMADSIEDGDAITYAARFYAAVADGQSFRSAHLQA